jgi:hypothetical protein
LEGGGEAGEVQVIDLFVGNSRVLGGWWFRASEYGDFVVTRINWGTEKFSCDI